MTESEFVLWYVNKHYLFTGSKFKYKYILDEKSISFAILYRNINDSIAIDKVDEHFYIPTFEITEENVIKILGPSHIKDKYQGNDIAGVVTGLAWTQVGGDILYIETSLSKSKAGKLTLTGNLGEVMKESIQCSLTAAIEWLKKE
mgnify:CR=1 FL=1